MERISAGEIRVAEEPRDQSTGSPIIGLESCLRPIVLQCAQLVRVIFLVVARSLVDRIAECEVADPTLRGSNQAIPERGRVESVADLESLAASPSCTA